MESFGSVDGPGLRYIIFLKGCPLRCLYCHNPETWGGKEGEKRSSEEMLQAALRYRPYWKGGGGITVSGGEPLLQMDFVTDLFRRANAQGVSTCIDTSGAVFSREPAKLQAMNELLAVTDLLLWDIKHIDSAKHKELTGMEMSIFWILLNIWQKSKSLCGFVMYWCRALMMMKKACAKLVSL